MPRPQQRYHTPSAIHLVLQDCMGMHIMYCKILFKRTATVHDHSQIQFDWSGTTTFASLELLQAYNQLTLPSLRCGS